MKAITWDGMTMACIVDEYLNIEHFRLLAFLIRLDKSKLGPIAILIFPEIKPNEDDPDWNK